MLRRRADGRLPHVVSPVCRGATAGADVAPRLSPRLQHRCASHAAGRVASPRGTWAALQAIARLAHAGAEAGDLHVTPFNGRLFAPARAPLLDHLALDDGRVARALEALCFTRAALDGGRQRIAYAELGVEELGSVYESLLDLEPVARTVAARARRPRRPQSTCAHPPARRARPPAPSTRPARLPTRSCATRWPRSWTGRSPEEILSLRVLDPAMGSGAFLVSAGRFLAAEWERALKRTRRRHGGRPVGGRSRGDASPDREPMPVRGRPQPDGGATGAAFAVAGDAGRRSAAVVSRSSPRGRQQPGGGLPTGRACTTSGEGSPAGSVAARVAVRVVGCARVGTRAAARTSRRRRIDSADIVHGKEAALAGVAAGARTGLLEGRL